MYQRWIVVAGLVIVSVASYFVVSNSSKDRVKELLSNAEANDSLTESAPQQQVAASWAIRDAEFAQVSQNGERNGLLAVCAGLLLTIAVSLAMIERNSRAEPGTAGLSRGATAPPPSSPSTESRPDNVPPSEPEV